MNRKVMIDAGRWMVLGILVLMALQDLLWGGLLLAGVVSLEKFPLIVTRGSTVLLLGRGLVALISAWGVYKWRSWGRILGVGLMILFVVDVLLHVQLDDIFTILNGLVAVGVLVLMIVWFFVPEVRNKFAGRVQAG